MAKTKSNLLYGVWKTMKNRCYNRRVESYTRYGGRGILVCEEWRTSFSVFEAWALSSGYANGLQIERRDNSGNYEPSNCTWATAKAQARNRTSNVLVTAFGETKHLTDWEHDPRCVITWRGLRKRLLAGVPPEIALTSPKLKGGTGPRFADMAVGHLNATHVWNRKKPTKP